jgi:hypothetical protein
MEQEKLAKKLIAGYFTTDELGCSLSDIRALRQAGYRVNSMIVKGKRVYSILTQSENPSVFISPKTKETQEFNWLELSDIHAGSIQFDSDGLIDILQRAQDAGITDVHISGDLCDGVKIYPGHMNNLLFWKAEDQAELLIEIFKEFPFNYYATKGNHDFSFEKQGAPSPLFLIEQEVPNFHFLNSFAGDLIICGVVKRMVHGASGRSYAKSYPGQTYIRDLLDSQGEHVYANGHKYRLRFIQMGHYHSNILYESAGIFVSHPGNFQFPNDYTIRRGLVGSQGSRLTKTIIANGKVVEFASNFIKPIR